MSNRYDTSGSAEGRYQAGSNDMVLENLLGITDVDKMEFIEFDALLALQSQLIDEVSMDQSITVAMVCDWHRRWLGEIYAWAGNFRSVNMAKGDFHFAVAHLIAGLMAKFEGQELKQFTPTDSFDKPGLIEALAITHVEFILIHPFRDGNGRLGGCLWLLWRCRRVTRYWSLAT